jgi:antitoxin PrlF
MGILSVMVFSSRPEAMTACYTIHGAGRGPDIDKSDRPVLLVDGSITRRRFVGTTVTVKGQVTLPKAVRDAAGIKPGDRVEVRATASGAVIIEKPGARDEYKARLYALAREQPIKGITTEELMEMTRGDD